MQLLQQSISTVLLPLGLACAISSCGAESPAEGTSPLDPVAPGGSESPMGSVPGGDPNQAAPGTTSSVTPGGVDPGAGDVPPVGGAGPAGTADPDMPTTAGTGDPDLPDNPLLNADVGTKVVHRLSNVEYDNTVADLLGTEQRYGGGFVHDEAEGFDNIAEALSMSPRLVEDYFQAALSLSQEVFSTPALRDRIVGCALDAEETCAETTIADFGFRAFRRPLERAELDWLLAVYDEALALGEAPEQAMQHVVHVALASPQFLYRIEFDPDPADDTPHALSAYEVASRLSYALWSSMPDDGLFALASSGELLEPAAREEEVDRMLADPRAEMLATNFVGQWLGARRLGHHVASSTIYPDFTPELGAAMQREMELYFLEFLTGDLPYTDFLSADFNFVDPTLAEHYGMPAPSGAGFERVEDTADQRSGVIGLAGFLTHTSRETRSSPIIRGKWILDSMWCLELTVPEDLVVEPLPEPEDGSEATNVRELIAAHRADPSCSVCHDLIDPIGLALEHFDGIGQYRTSYADETPVDATGELPSGAMVDGLSSLSTELTSDPQFVPCVAKKFTTYALGRGGMDRAYLDDIVARFNAGGLTLRSLIKASVTSDTFLMRRAVTQ